MRNYFCGWYFRCQSDRQTIAVIPSVHRTKDSDFCTIQLITDKEHSTFVSPTLHFRRTKIIFPSRETVSVEIVSGWTSNQKSFAPVAMFISVLSHRFVTISWDPFVMSHSCSAGTVFSACTIL